MYMNAIICLCYKAMDVAEKRIGKLIRGIVELEEAKGFSSDVLKTDLGIELANVSREYKTLKNMLREIPLDNLVGYEEA